MPDKQLLLPIRDGKIYGKTGSLKSSERIHLMPPLASDRGHGGGARDALVSTDRNTGINAAEFSTHKKKLIEQSINKHLPHHKQVE